MPEGELKGEREPSRVCEWQISATGFTWIKPTISDRSERERERTILKKREGWEELDVTHKGIESKLQISGISIGNRESV